MRTRLLLLLVVLLSCFAMPLFAGILDGGAEILGTNFGNVNQGQAVTRTFELKLLPHIRDYTFQVTKVPAPYVVSPMSGTITGLRQTFSVTLPATAPPGVYSSLNPGATVSHIEIRVDDLGQPSMISAAVRATVIGFPFVLSSDNVSFGRIKIALPKEVKIRRNAGGNGPSRFTAVSNVSQIQVSPASGELTGSQEMTLSIQVPANVGPGSYRGEIIVTDTGSNLKKTIQVSAEVLR